MYLPDVRNRYEEPLYKGTKGAKEQGEGPRENPYWEGNLKPEDKETVWGYDWCVEAAETAFSNLDGYALECEADVRPSDVRKVLEDFRGWLLDWLEAHRNELVVSILDNYEDEED